VLVLAAISLVVQAQTFPFRVYTSVDGLPQTQQANVMQDSRGFIWIPTRNGIARSDGHTFISYLRKDGLPSNLVTKVVEDKNGTIWAVTVNGLARFNGKTFISYPLPDSLGVKQFGFGCLGRDSASFLLSASMNYEQHAIILFENSEYRNLSERHPVLQNRELTPVAANATDSIIYFTEGNDRVYEYHDDTLNCIYSGPISDVKVVDGIPIITKEPVNYGIGIDPFYWEGSLPVFSFTDREGTVWVGSETSIYRLMSEAFIEYDRTSGLPDETWAVAADPNGGLWTGSLYGEMKYFDGKRFRSRNEYMQAYGDMAVFYRGSTTLSNGEVWFSTQSGVLVWNGRRFSKLNLLPDSLQVCIIYEDPVDKTVFIGADKGLFHIEGKKVTLYTQMSWPKYGIVEGIVRDLNGNYWLAGHYGMVFFDGKDFVPFREAPAPSEMAWGVICDYKGTIWSASSDGLFICDPENPGFKAALPEEINMPASVIRDMGDGRLLVGRMVDICIIDLNKYYSGIPEYYRIIGHNDGFRGIDCQDNGIVRDTEGNWWILTTDRLIRFDPDKTGRNEHPPITHITLVEGSGDASGWNVILDSALFYGTSNKVIIRGRHNSTRVTYTGISTRNPEGVTYQYRITGFKNTWSQRERENNAILTDLPTGNYMFEVRSVNSDGVISENPDTLEITVVPTFFQSLFAHIFFSIVVLGLLVMVIWKVRLKVSERRIAAARQQAESYRLQLNSVIKQFDPHFTFNAVTSVGSLIMKGEKERAYQYFIKLSNLLRSILADTSTLLKPLEQELDFVSSYCELQKLRFGNRFDYSVTVAPDVNLKAPVPKMIIQSFAENALKHGLENKKGKGVLEIKINNISGGTEVIVRDNGIGRAAASMMHTQGAGTGLKNIASIINTINRANNEKITFTLIDLHENGKASGTEVRVFLPFNYSFILPYDNTATDKI